MKRGYGNTLANFRVEIPSPPQVQYRHTREGAERLAQRFPGSVVTALKNPVKILDT